MLSKLALMGAFAYQTTQANQLYTSVEQDMTDMLNLYQDV